MADDTLTPTDPTSVAPPITAGNEISVIGAPPPVPLSGKTVPMLSPSGTVGDIPKENVSDAVKSGFKVGVSMISPDGKPGVIPMDKVHDAIGSGFHIDDPTLNALSDSSGITGLFSGAGKGMSDTMRGVSTLATGNPDTIGGPKLPPASGISEKIGKAGEAVLEFMLGDEALKGLSLGDKLTKIAPTIQALEQHPALAKVVGGALQGATVGGGEGAVKGAESGNAVSGAVSGAAMGAAGGAIAPTIEAARGVKVTPKNPWAAARTIIRNATRSPEAEGAAVEQPLAQAGIKANAPTVGASFRSGIDVDTPFKEAKTLYKAVDDATGTKFQDLYEKLDAAKDAERVAPSGSPEEARASQTVKNQEDFINDMRERAKSAGVNVDRTLAAADKKFAEAQANKEFNNKFFGNQGILKGNATQGAPETVNVQKAIDTLESMDKPNKYGLSRLQQTSLGKNGVAALKQSLYDAQKAGQAAMDARQFRNTILKFAGIGGGALAGTYELTK